MSKDQKCFAYDERVGGACKVLIGRKENSYSRVYLCEGDSCVFKKTTKQLLRDRRIAWARINKLHPENKRHIVEVYFGGKIPEEWLTEEGGKTHFK